MRVAMLVEVPTRRRDGGGAEFDYVTVKLGGTELDIPDRFSLIYKPEASEPGWRMEFAVRDGVPQCRSITIEATADGREVRAADLRALRLEDLVELAASSLARPERVVVNDKEELVHHLSVARRAVTAARRGGKQRITDEVLREVAEVYRNNIGDSPTEAVGRHLGVADRTARLYVKRARDAGHLGKALKGKAGEK